MSKSTNKYGAKPVWYNLTNEYLMPDDFKPLISDGCEYLYFPSKWEFTVWTYLKLLTGNDSSALVLQPKLLLLQPTEQFAALTWKVDFLIQPTLLQPYLPVLLVEAKGIRLEDFKLKYRMTAGIYPQLFKRLAVIGDHPPERILGTALTIDLQTFGDMFKQLYNYNLTNKRAEQIIDYGNFLNLNK